MAALYSQGVPIIPKCIYPIDPQVKFHSELRTLDSHMESITLKELILPASYACTEPREMKPHTHTHTHIYIYIYIERERAKIQRYHCRRPGIVFLLFGHSLQFVG